MKISHKLLLAAAMLPIGASVAAQTEPWTLDSCINYAIQHNINVRQQAVQVATAEMNVTEAKDQFLPALSGQAGQSFNFGRGLTSNNTYANRNTQNTSFGLGLDLPLFQGMQRVRRLDYAKVNLRAVVEELASAKDNVELNVMSQYLQVLYCAELEKVAQEQVRMSEYELNRRRTLVEEGKLPELDLYEAQSQLARDQLSVTTSHNDWSLALLDLAQMLQLPSPDDFRIAELAPTPAVDETADHIFAHALEANHGMRASRLQVEAAERQVGVAQTGWFPTLSFNAGLSANYFKVNGEYNPPFRRQMRDNFSKYVGFSLQVPIFDRFSTRNSVRRARAQRVTAELQYEQRATDLYKAIQQARYQADAADAKLRASLVAEEASLKALEGVTAKYNYGKATSSDYEQARSSYLRSVLERTQAEYERILRRRILAFYQR